MDWFLKNKKADFDLLRKSFSLSDVFLKILVNRGLTQPEQINKFLHPEQLELFDPSRLMNAEKAAQMLSTALSSGEFIRIIGDYDVDGIMSTYIFYRSLRLFTGQVDYRIPDRLTDGYGMNRKMVEEAVQSKVALLLTCDNGISAAEPITFAKDNDIKVIVTDHHEIPNHLENGKKVYDLPPADVIVDPKQSEDTYPQKGICGAFVSYKVISLLLSKQDDSFFDKEGGREAFLQELRIMAAIATVCDVMELTDENRTLVKEGLRNLSSSKNIGLQALITACELKNREVSVYHTGFILGPCFNATGRLSSALEALKLLLCENYEEALSIAEDFRNLNEERKKLTKNATDQAVSLAEQKLTEGKKVLVLFLPNCHESIAGIVAGRIRERFYRPAIVLTRGEKEVKGSGRSIEGYSMFEKLTEQKEFMLHFGGHKMAAGLSLSEENIMLLEQKLNEAANLSQEQLTEKLTIDAILPFSYINEELIKELSLLEPVGTGNEKPVFADSGVSLLNLKKMGKGGEHVRMMLLDITGVCMDGLLFQKAEEFDKFITSEYGENTLKSLYNGKCSEEIRLTVAFSPSINEFQGRRNPQITIQAYKRTVSN